MKASELIKELPETDIIKREELIIKYIENGWFIKPTMVEIKSEYNGNTAVIKVMSDSLMIGEEDDFLRINATALCEQKISDMLKMSMLTSKISDLVFFNSKVQIEPCIQKPDGKMSHTSRMIKHSNDVNESIASVFFGYVPNESITRGSIGLVADVGKDWILSNRLLNKKGSAANYGWHTKRPFSKSGPFKCTGGGSIWQNVGTVHNNKHVDYSQVIRLMDENIIVNDQHMSFKEVATDKIFHNLISYEGQLKVFRL